MTSPLISLLIVSYLCSVASNTCMTPEGIEGVCKELHSCPHLIDMLTSNPTQATLLHLQRSICEGPGFYVCCGWWNAETVDSLEEEQQCQLTAFPPDPNTGCCGIDASGGNRIVGGTETTIEEYPWLALIEYRLYNSMQLGCGGVLISGKHVMTAGHCIEGPSIGDGVPDKVRLGEYDTSNSGPDCMEVEGGGEDCTDGAVSIPIERIIRHPDYESTSKLRLHDIALLRLTQTVEYTDFIRPICLPSTDFTKARPENITLYTAGWGAVSQHRFSSNIKMKVGLPYVSYEDCQPAYNVAGRRVTLWEGQLCAGGVIGQDSCRGDSGGPLMMTNGELFELVGIVSYGPAVCGLDQVPGVYTKVFHYLPWIRSQI